jgi:imidazoleglycerol phosphate dehydratase HisB
MKRRTSVIRRKTGETEISLRLVIDGAGKHAIDTPIGFLSHMLEQFAAHGLFDLEIKAAGDMGFDDHHVAEDIGIVLGQAFAEAAGGKAGINRYGFFVLPMDDVLTTAAFDFSGRYGFRFDAGFAREKIGDLSAELIRHFWDAFAQNSRSNLFIRSEYGYNDHHRAESIFKAAARSIRMACEPDPRAGAGPPSTKGSL